MEINFNNFPELVTERLILRNIENNDIELIHKLHSDPIVNAFVGRNNSSNLKLAEAYITKMHNLIAKNECIYWVVTEKGKNDLIGSVCLWNFDIENEIVEIGYEMLNEFQGKGIMTEVIKKVVEYAFTVIKPKLITAFPSSDNLSSVTLLKKLNFKLENKNYNNTHENVKNLVTYILRNNEAYLQ